MQRQSREAAATNMIAFPEASTLVFENLPNFVTFGSDDLVVKWPSLEDVTVNYCPKIKYYGLGHVDISQLKSVDVKIQGQEEVDSERMIARYFELSDILSSIEEYKINDSEELSKTLTTKLKPTHFTNLKQFEVKNCDERLNDFLSILLKRSERLQQLIVEECKSLKHVFNLNELVSVPDERGNGKYFPDLKTMKLRNLPQLNWIWNKDPTGIFGLGHLETIEVMKCGSLKNLISVSAAEKLQQLKALKLHSCGKVEEVVAKENQGVETRIEFPQLSELELIDLSNFIKFHRGNRALEFPSLRSLKINNCPQMVAFTTGFASAEDASTTDEKSFTMLSELELDKCGKLIYVIPSTILPRFKNLEKLTVRNCDSLKEVFPFHEELHSVEPMLSKLNELVLIELSKLIYVINTEFGNARFFERLQILLVKCCNSLEHLHLPFSAGSLKLREIEISHCETLKEISVAEEENITSQILFPDLKSIVLANLPNLSTFSPGTSEFPSLKRLEVVDCPALKTFVSPSSNNYLNSELLELEELTLINSKTLLNIIPSNMLIRYKKLMKMTVEGCELLKKVFDLENVITDNNDKEILPQMSELILNNLPELEHVWNKEPQIPIFQNLESLQIMDCDNLKRLFSVSTAECLKKLRTLKLYGCKNMEEVFAEENESREITFPMVECLILKDLPNLVSFHGHSCTFKWPKLRIVRVSNIPKMETFSKENPETPLLRTVYVTFVKKCWQGDLNSTINYLHDNAEVSS